MQNFNRIEHPVLTVNIGGNIPQRRPSSFSLMTDEGFPSVQARLRFPSDEITGKTGGEATVNMAIGSEEHLLFTGEIYSAGVHGGCRDMSLTDGYKKLCDNSIIAAYRKEKAKAILQDILDKAGIDKTAITCPAVEIARFSTESIPAEYVIKLLIKALEEHGCMGLRYFFDADNKFHFGTADDTGKNEGTVYEFDSGKNILKLFNGWMEVLPLPIRHSQEVIVNGVKLIASRTDLFISGSHSRLRLWLKREK